MQLGMFEKQKSIDWKWWLKDLDSVDKNGLKVFSTFACGGGSSMGYKLAGCEMVGCLEIDKRMNEVYVKNLNPKHNYLMDIRDFNKLPNDKLPQELFELDILDGSPPCSTFSMAGQREDSWGVEKKFKEGQKLQTLDDLLFVFIETVEKLQPKVAIMENVEGLTLGGAWKYVQEIYKKFNEIGYQVKHWLLKGEQMGIPQTRHRVFFIATKIDFNLESIDMGFDYEPVKYKEIKTGKGKEVAQGSKSEKLLLEVRDNENNLSFANQRLYGKNGWFQSMVIDDNIVFPTIRAKLSDVFRRGTLERVTIQDVINSQTFPQDYDFAGKEPSYIIGMSVPPVMIKRIMERLLKSGIFNYKLKEKKL